MSNYPTITNMQSEPHTNKANDQDEFQLQSSPKSLYTRTGGRDRDRDCIDIDSFSLDFRNYCDLQTRLIMLPYDDSECTGAVIHSFQEYEQCQEQEQGQAVGSDAETILDEIKKCSNVHVEEQHKLVVDESDVEDSNIHINNNSNGNGNEKTSDDHAAGQEEEDLIDSDATQAKTHEEEPQQQEDTHATPNNDKNEIEIDADNENENDNDNSLKQINAENALPQDVKVAAEGEGEGDTDVVPYQNDGSTSIASNGAPSADTRTDNNVQEETKEAEEIEGSIAESKLPQKIEGAVLIRIQGSNNEISMDYRTCDFTTILNTIRDIGSSSIVLHFEHPNTDTMDGGSSIDPNGRIECIEDEPEEDSKADGRNNEHDLEHAKAIAGKLQRWGSQFAGEARKAVIAGRELAIEKVNEVQHQRQKEISQSSGASQQPVAVGPKQPLEVDVHVPKNIQVQNTNVKPRVETKQDAPYICGMFLQTSSGKCIPLCEELYAPKRTRNDSEADDNQDRRRRKNPFRKNPPKITNTSVLVIRTSAEKPCPTLGYKYQWYRTKQSPIGNDDQELNFDDSWTKLDGATSVVFQPSATDVGFRVKCVVTVSNHPEHAGSLVNFLKSAAEIESDKVLYDAALKTFKPMNGDDARICVSSFDNMVGMEGMENIRIKLDLHTFRSEENEGYRCFFMKAFNSSEEPLYGVNEQITNMSVGTYCDKATAFYLKWHSKEQQIERILKLKAPSRIARESFLLALGIASFEGVHTDLNTLAVLFRPSYSSDENDADEANEATKEENDDSTHIESDTNSDIDDDAQQLRTTTPPLNPILSSISADTPGTTGRRMIAIESELENDMNELKDRLDSKNKVVSDLQDELNQLRLDHTVQREGNIETKKTLRISERRIESLESDLARLKEDQIKRSTAYEKQIRDHKDSDGDYQKLIKSLGNEKAVLSAAVEARDSKLIRMDELKQEVHSLKEKVEKDRKVQSQMDEVSTKNSDLKHTIMEMKRKEKFMSDEISGMKQNMESTNTEFERQKKASTAAKAEVEKAATQMQTLRAERNRWKQKADSLVKEMSRICRGGRDIADIEQLIQDHQNLTKEVTLLRSQKKKAEDELEESLIVHARYVQARETVKAEGEAIRAVQKCDELERLVSHLTEYVDAKETQLQSIQDVNRALTEELHLAHQKNRGDNDV